ncbi:ferric reductase-like protein, putative [Bodo saltans]|uniref:Ferric reductase-like protein, putative n=1 Tax=Bodo saltans TaxID=75058 RepID=A0A0S4JDF4_BODSA|nr:ferric reductase-like protein, putative [Bodo saltans]|eukprot:CUG87225.1 ferric reductase-like protein, putative [Bodo saltans]
MIWFLTNTIVIVLASVVCCHAAPTTTPPIVLSVASGNLTIQLSYNSTTLWGMMAIADGYSGTFGVVSSQGGMMEGSMISCYGGNGGSINPTCIDLDGQDFFVTLAPNRSTTFLSALINGSFAMLNFSAPTSRFPFLAETSLISYCYSPYNASTGLPVQHSSNDGTDHGSLSVNFMSGAVTTGSTSLSSRDMAYIIVGVILGAAILVAVVVARVSGVHLTPKSTLILQVSTTLLLWAMVGVVTALVTIGEATCFVLAIILIPTTKHVGLGVLVGSSYERMLFLHPVLGVTVLVTMTIHMISMFSSLDDPSTLCGFISWICLICLSLPAMFLRRKSYNLFRFTHCLFILVLVFGVLHHGELLVMLIPGFALWVVDLLLRLYSAISAKTHVVELAYDEQADIVTLKLSVDWAMAPEPGSYAFILIPSLSPISHPFTIALAEDVDTNDISRRVLTFLVKPVVDANTFTGKLAELAKASTPLTITMFGPYGKLQVPVADCRHVVLVSGGIGVTPMVSILEHIATNAANLPLLQTLTFIWVTRDQAVISFLKETIDSLASVCAEKVRVTIHFFDTSASRLLVIPQRGNELPEMPSPHEPLAGDPRLTSGRPNFQKIFGTVHEKKSVGCYICGPQSLIDSAAKEASLHGFWIHSETFEF